MKWSFDAIGTKWHIDIPDTLASQECERLLLRVHERIDAFDKVYSRFRADSLVTKMSTQAGVYPFPPDADAMFTLYRELYDLTNGAFTPLIGNLLSDAGYDAAYSLKPRELHSPFRWSEALEWNPPNLTMKKPAMLDFGAAGKGYLIDLVGDVLREAGVETFCVDAGGDIKHHDVTSGTLRVGLEHPMDTTKVIGVVTISNQSICGSAGNRRVWANFHHTINPQTLTSPKHILASWVIAPTTMLADAMTTCLYFVQGRILTERYPCEYVFVKKDLTVEQSKGFPAELF